MTKQDRIQFHPSPRCKLCKVIEIDPGVKAEVEGTTAFKASGTSARQLCRKYNIQPHSWYGHIRKHHYAVTMHKGASKELVAETVAQEAVVARESKVRENYESVWDAVLNQGLDRIASGEMKVTSLMVMKAASDKAAYMGRKQDRKLEAVKMVWAFAAGKKEPEELDAGTTT